MNKRAVFWTLFAFLMLLSCNNEPTNIIPVHRPVTGVSPKQQAPANTGPVYGNYFKVRNASTYQKLLWDCRRCGEEKLYGHSGGAIYQRFYVPDGHPTKCESWTIEGYIQIEFAEKKLPTRATVSFWPKFTGTAGLVYDEWNIENAFSVTSTANPINENQGFQILITPTDGLGGLSSLSIESSYSNHVTKDALDISVVYGTDKSEIVVGLLEKLKVKALKQALFDCSTYTN